MHACDVLTDHLITDFEPSAVEPGAVEVVKLPELWTCPKCKRKTRYYFVSCFRCCIICQPPWDITDSLWISGAKLITSPGPVLWLPRYPNTWDSWVLAELIFNVLSVRPEWWYCPKHSTTVPPGASVTNLCQLARVQYGWERKLVGEALAVLMRRERIYRTGKGVKGNPYQYHRRRYLCCA